jgi:hypothetical protein
MTQGLAKQRIEVPGDSESEEGCSGLRSYKANPKIGLPSSKVDNELFQRHFKPYSYRRDDTFRRQCNVFLGVLQESSD